VCVREDDPLLETVENGRARIEREACRVRPERQKKISKPRNEEDYYGEESP
jgi:hypothetical protein